jgi:hypothetical protein
LYNNHLNLKRDRRETDKSWEEAVKKRDNAMEVLKGEGKGCDWVKEPKKARSKSTMEKEARAASEYLRRIQTSGGMI